MATPIKDYTPIYGAVDTTDKILGPGGFAGGRGLMSGIKDEKHHDWEGG